MIIEHIPTSELYGEFAMRGLSVDIERIARACHEANRAMCASFGDHSQLPWGQAEQWQRDSAIAGVKFRLENPDAGVDCQHNAWMQDKIDNGWKYGTKKDAELKEHPCIVPFDQLPPEQKAKDAIFSAIVNGFNIQPAKNED